MTVDLHADAFLRHPGAGAKTLRDEAELVRMRLPILGPVWVTTTHATAYQVLSDPVTYVRNPANAGGKPPEKIYWWVPRFVHPLFRNVTLMDHEDHKRLRKLVTDAFSSRGIDAMRPRIEAIADDLLEKLPSDRPADLVANFNRLLPMLAICELLGVPEADREKVSNWIEPISRVRNPFSFLRAAPGLYRMSRYFRADFDDVRRSRRPGLIRELVEVRDGEDKLSDDELLAMVVAVFIGGFDTTTHLIGNSLVTLLQAPDLAKSLVEEPRRIPFFIEEVMRYHSPVMFTNMFHVTEETTLGGRTLQRGERVVPLLIAANRDPQRFDDPGEFIADRKPNRHLGFGIGTHMCLGMQLARAEATVAITRFFTRYPNARLARPLEEIPMLKRLGLRGVAELPVLLES